MALLDALLLLIDLSREFGWVFSKPYHMPSRGVMVHKSDGLVCTSVLNSLFSMGKNKLIF